MKSLKDLTVSEVIGILAILLLLYTFFQTVLLSQKLDMARFVYDATGAIQNVDGRLRTAEDKLGLSRVPDPKPPVSATGDTPVKEDRSLSKEKK